MFYRRFGRLICLVAFCVTPLLWWAAAASFRSNANDVLDWLPSHFEETARLIWFAERFGSDEILVVSWPGCTLEDPRLQHLAVRLVRPFRGGRSESPRVLFRHVFTGRQTLDDLTRPPLKLSRQEAIRRMEGWLVGPDGETTCAVALVSEAGSADRQAAVAAAYEAAAEVGLRRSEVRIGGPTADGVAIDQASQQWMFAMIGLSACCALLTAWWCLRNWRLVGTVFFVASFAWAGSLAILYCSGTNMDAVLMMMPGLVFVLTISGAVHLSHYYQSAAVEVGPCEAPVEAVLRGLLPCTLAAGTTAIGLGSLTLSEVTPVVRFGLFSAIGVLFSLATLLLLWPSATLWWSSRTDRPGAVDRTTRSPDRQRHWFRPLFWLATRHSVLLVAVAVMTIPPLVYGVTRIRTSAQLEDLLARDSELIRSYTWLQDHIGPLVPVEIVLRFTPAEPVNAGILLRRAEIVEQIRHDLEQWPELGAAVAATTFAPALPKGRGARQVVRRRIIANRLLRRRADFAQLRYVVDDPAADEALWRISARAEALKGVDYGQLLRRLETELEGRLAAARKGTEIDVRAAICGAVPLIYMAQEQLLRDLIKSFMAAFALIGLTMAILMRSPAAGLIAMVPSALPVLLIFGTMGLIGATVDIGAMMTASVALGIAVDDTLHFLIWFRRGLRSGLSRRAAIQRAYQRCGSAMLQTSVICGAGLLVFLLSPFQPTAQFGWLMALLLTAALAGDLLLLPALLASPFGRPFVPVRTGTD